MLPRVIALLGALAVLAAIALTLRAPSTPLIATNGIRPVAFVGEARAPQKLCAAGVVVPRQADAVRITLGTYGRDDRTVWSVVGERRGAPLRDAAEGVVDVPLPVARREGDALCFQASRGRFAIAGEPGASVPAPPGRPIPGLLSVVFLEAQPPPWSGLAGGIADRLGYGKGALGGPATAWVIAGAGLGGLVAAFALAWRAFGPRPPSPRRAAAGAAAVAVLCGTTWALLIPPFQMADETAHFAYVQHVAETGEIPGGALERAEFSTDLSRTLDALNFSGIVGRPLVKAVPTPEADARVEAVLAADHPEDDGGGPSTASGQPGLFYGLAALGYRALGGELLTGFYGARLISVLLFGATAAFVVLLAAELLPGVRWVPPLAGTFAALVPILGFVSSSVNPDALLFAAAAAVLLMGTRLLRRSITTRSAVAFGAAVGAGLTAKLTFLAIAPAVLIVALLALRRGPVRATAGRLAAAAAVAAVPLGAYVVWASLTGDGPFQISTRVTPLPADAVGPASVREQLVYAWQLYLPRLPFMRDMFDGWPFLDLWLQGMIGGFGWLDYSLSPWIYAIARWVAGAALLSLAVWLIRERAGLARRWRDLAFFAVAAAGLAATIAKAGYDYRRATGQGFEQARYLLPLLGVFSVAGVGACLGWGRRLAPAAAAVLLSLLALVQLASWMATISRYYV